MHYSFKEIPLEMELGEIETRGVDCWPGGHVGWTVDGVTFLEISRTDEILPVLEHLSKQLVG